MSIHTPFESFPEFTTDRLFLRMVKEKDVPYLFEIKADAETTAKYGRKPHTEVEQTSRWVSEILKDYVGRKTLYWAVTLKGKDDPIGSFTLWNIDLDSYMAELGYELNRKYWRSGIMLEALNPMIGWAFREMGLNRIEACPMKMNKASIGLLEKLGFKFEGNLRERIFFNGKFEDQLYYSILKSDWEIMDKMRQ